MIIDDIDIEHLRRMRSSFVSVRKQSRMEEDLMNYTNQKVINLDDMVDKEIECDI